VLVHIILCTNSSKERIRNSHQSHCYYFVNYLPSK
jgi:hypothetical protein